MDDPSQHRTLLICGRGSTEGYKFLSSSSLLHYGRKSCANILDPEISSLSHGHMSYPTTPSAWQQNLPDGHDLLKLSVHVSLCLNIQVVAAGYCTEYDMTIIKLLMKQHTFLYNRTVLSSFWGKVKKVIATFPVRKKREFVCWDVTEFWPEKRL